MLRRIVSTIDARVGRVVGAHDLSVAEWRLLSALHRAGAVPPSLLAERLGVTRGGVTKLIDRLKARRLLVRAGTGGADRRFQTIALTGAGAVLVRDLTAAVAEAETLLDEERALLADVLV